MLGMEVRKMVGIGCAGWSLPREAWPAFAEQGTHLQRYSGELSVVEINSSFYRPHRPATYRKWAASVPEDFRFCVKLPRQISHELRLRECDEALERFLGESTELAEKLGIADLRSFNGGGLLRCHARTLRRCTGTRTAAYELAGRR